MQIWRKKIKMENLVDDDLERSESDGDSDDEPDDESNK